MNTIILSLKAKGREKSEFAICTVHKFVPHLMFDVINVKGLYCQV